MVQRPRGQQSSEPNTGVSLDEGNTFPVRSAVSQSSSSPWTPSQTTLRSVSQEDRDVLSQEGVNWEAYCKSVPEITGRQITTLVQLRPRKGDDQTIENVTNALSELLPANWKASKSPETEQAVKNISKVAKHARDYGIFAEASGTGWDDMTTGIYFKVKKYEPPSRHSPPPRQPSPSRVWEHFNPNPYY